MCPTDVETFRYILMLASRYSAFATDDSAARLLPIVRHTALLYSDGGRDVAELRNVTLMSNIMVAAKATLAKLDGTEMRRVLVAMRPLLVPSTRSATLSTEGGVAELPTIPTELALQMERGYEAVVTLNDSMGLDSIVVMLSAIRIIAPVLNREDYKRFWASMRPFLLDLGEPGGAGAQALAQNIVQLQTSTPPGSPELTELFAPGVLGLAAATNFSLMSGALIAPFAAPFFEGTGASLGAGEFDVMLDLTRKVMSSTSPEEITALVAAVQRRADSLNAGADVQELQILNMMTVAQLLAQDHDPELFAVVMSDVFTPLVSGLIGSGGDAELLEAASLMQGMLEAVTDLYGGPYADVVSPETMELLLLLLHAVALDLDVLQTEDLDAIRAHVLGTTGALNGALLEATLCLRG